MAHYNGKIGNSTFGTHTTAINGVHELIIIISKVPYPTRIKLGIIQSRKPKKSFINCKITSTSLIFKVGADGMQEITVTVNGIEPRQLLDEIQRSSNLQMTVRYNL